MKPRMIVLCLFFARVSSAASDWSPPDFSNCAFYENAEKNVHCSSNGSNYLIGYGKQYCTEFRKKLDEWKEHASLREWVSNTGLCLQEMLFDNRKKRLNPCTQLEEFAFDAHPVCYKQYGICKLGLANLYRIANVLKLVDLLTRRSLAQIDNVGLACLSNLFSPEEKATYSQVYIGTSSQTDETKRIAIKLFELAPTNSKRNRTAYFQKLLPEVLFDSPSPVAREASTAYAKAFRLKDMASRSTDETNDCLDIFTDGPPPTNCNSRTKEQLLTLKGRNRAIVYKDVLTEDRLRRIFQRMHLPLSPTN